LTLSTEFLETLEESAYRESYAVSEDSIRHVAFETNHPDLDVSDGDTDNDDVYVLILTGANGSFY